MKNKDWGRFDYRYNKHHSLLFIRWNDNSVITMATNYDGIELTSQWWQSKKNEKIYVPQLQLFSTYNTSLEGVNILDQSVDRNWNGINGKKWWWVLFTHMINVTGDTIKYSYVIQRICCYSSEIFGRSALTWLSGSLPRKKMANQQNYQKCNSVY